MHDKLISAGTSYSSRVGFVGSLCLVAGVIVTAMVVFPEDFDADVADTSLMQSSATLTLSKVSDHALTKDGSHKSGASYHKQETAKQMGDQSSSKRSSQPATPPNSLGSSSSSSKKAHVKDKIVPETVMLQGTEDPAIAQMRTQAKAQEQKISKDAAASQQRAMKRVNRQMKRQKKRAAKKVTRIKEKMHKAEKAPVSLRRTGQNHLKAVIERGKNRVEKRFMRAKAKIYQEQGRGLQRMQETGTGRAAIRAARKIRVMARDKMTQEAYNKYEEARLVKQKMDDMEIKDMKQGLATKFQNADDVNKFDDRVGKMSDDDHVMDMRSNFNHRLFGSPSDQKYYPLAKPDKIPVDPPEGVEDVPQSPQGVGILSSTSTASPFSDEDPEEDELVQVEAGYDWPNHKRIQKEASAVKKVGMVRYVESIQGHSEILTKAKMAFKEQRAVRIQQADASEIRRKVSDKKLAPIFHPINAAVATVRTNTHSERLGNLDTSIVRKAQKVQNEVHNFDAKEGTPPFVPSIRPKESAKHNAKPLSKQVTTGNPAAEEFSEVTNEDFFRVGRAATWQKMAAESRPTKEKWDKETDAILKSMQEAGALS